MSTTHQPTAALNSCETHFPDVRVFELPTNLGFGGGSNAGFRAAKNDIVVLLNSDMRVERGFLQPLLDGFTDELVFAVSCQIFFSDPAKLREETGLTQAWWQGGRLRVRHRIDDALTQRISMFLWRRRILCIRSSEVPRARRVRYPSASVLPGRYRPRLPGLEAWLEGAISAAQRRISRASRNHRQEVFTALHRVHPEEELRSVLLEEYPRMAKASEPFRRVMGRRSRQQRHGRFAGAHKSCWTLASTLTTAWGRSCAMASQAACSHHGHGSIPPPARRLLPRSLHTASCSPGTSCPCSSSRRTRSALRLTAAECSCIKRRPSSRNSTDLHLIVLLDFENQRAPHDELAAHCASAEFVVRMTGRAHSFGSVHPHAVAEFSNGDLEWLIHRQILLKDIDVLAARVSAAWASMRVSSAKFRASCSSTISTSSRLRASCPA